MPFARSDDCESFATRKRWWKRWLQLSRAPNEPEMPKAQRETGFNDPRQCRAVCQAPDGAVFFSLRSARSSTSVNAKKGIRIINHWSRNEKCARHRIGKREPEAESALYRNKHSEYKREPATTAWKRNFRNKKKTQTRQNRLLILKNSLPKSGETCQIRAARRRRKRRRIAGIFIVHGPTLTLRQSLDSLFDSSSSCVR